MPKHKQELPPLVGDQLAGVDVLKNVSAAVGYQDLVHLEDARILLEWDYLQCPGICAYRDHSLRHEVLRPFPAEPRFTPAVARIIFANQFDPASVKQHHIALFDSHALGRSGSIDLGFVEGRALGYWVGFEVRCHVEHYAACHDGWDLFDTKLLEPIESGEVSPLVTIVINIADTDVTKSIELGADADPAVQDVIVVGRVGVPSPWAEPT